MLKKATLEITLFVSGAIILIFELVGARILAPYLGTTIFVWTALIGIILASLSLGYYFGGRWADKKPRPAILSLIILLAALAVALTIFLREPFLNYIQHNIASIRLGALLASTVLFLPASLFLGMVSPYIVKLKLAHLEHTGQTVGALCAISTMGSISGTFLAGFYLIPNFAISSILILLAATLLALSVLISLENLARVKILLLLLSLVGLLLPPELKAQDVLVDQDTAYGRARILEHPDLRSGRQVRELRINDATNSSMFVEQPTALVHDYTKYYHLVRHFNPHFETSLILGGGAFSFPKSYLATYPGAKLDVVEIDPQITQLAREYFALPEEPRLKIIAADARTYINRTSKKYDAIFADTFRTHFELPYQLTTREAIQKKYDLLNPDGAVFVNIISSIDGSTGEFLRAEYATYQDVFHYVYLFPVSHPHDPGVLQNIVLVAVKTDRKPSFKSQDPQLNNFLKNVWSQAVPKDQGILTDDYVPVEHLMRATIDWR